jgi:hypothetical protein
MLYMSSVTHLVFVKCPKNRTMHIKYFLKSNNKDEKIYILVRNSWYDFKLVALLFIEIQLGLYFFIITDNHHNHHNYTCAIYGFLNKKKHTCKYIMFVLEWWWLFLMSFDEPTWSFEVCNTFILYMIYQGV